MYPQLIHLKTSLGLVHISSYSFFLWIAILVVIFGFYRRCRVHTLSRWNSFIYSASMISIAVVGARLFHIASNISLYQKYPAQIFAFHANGFSIYGAILLVGIGGFLTARITSFPIWKMSDEMVPFIGIGIAIARIGCFLNGCCSGKVSNLPWAVRFPLFSEAHLYQMFRDQTNLITVLPVHPTQLYEAIGALMSIFVAMSVQKKKNSDGVGILVFLASFSIVRLIIHYLRVFPNSFLGIEPVFPAVYIAVLLFSLMFYNFKYTQSKSKNFKEAI